MIPYAVMFCLLFLGFLLLFRRIHWLKLAADLLRQTREGIDEAARRRVLEDRRRLLSLQNDNNVWYHLEQLLYYSGWKRRMPGLTAEGWLAGNLLAAAVLFLLLLLTTRRLLWVLAGICLFAGGEYLLLCICRFRETRAVNDSLLKLLNFLGNYSITSGEATEVFRQVSRYVEEPLKSALEQCAYEAQITGDAGMAMLSMAEKVEHPKFKELARNMEVSIRYSADFTALVEGSRRSVREYLRSDEERKGMLREAVVNMALLLGMSLFALLTVDRLIETSVWQLLCFTLPGRMAMGIVGLIFVLLLRQLYCLR